MEINLSEAEQVFIIHGAQEGYRNDGRGKTEFRPIKLETEVMEGTNGSARVRCGGTDVLVGVKAEIDAPEPHNPKIGVLRFAVDASANATPQFAGRGGEEMVQWLASALQDAYASPIAFPLSKLCLVSGALVWHVNVDVVVLECGGNIADVASIGVKAALSNTRLPTVNVVHNAEKDCSEVELTDDQFDVWRLNLASGGFPLLMTVSKLGTADVVDTSQEEEFCSKSQVVVGVSTTDETFLVRKTGQGSLDPQSLKEMTSMAVEVGKEMNRTLLKRLADEEALEGKVKTGFLF